MSKPRLRILKFLFLSSLLILPACGGGGTGGGSSGGGTTPLALTVGGTGSYSTVQSAINAANSGDTVKVAQGTYAENISISTSKTVAILGGWSKDFSYRSEDSSLTVIDGKGLKSTFDIHAGANTSINVTLEGVTIRNGKAEKGGGLHAESSGSGVSLILNLKNVRISNNKSDVDGGGFWAESSQSGAKTELTISNSIISENASREGGAASLTSFGGGTVIAVFDLCQISLNTATDFAGGVWINSSGGSTKVTLSRSAISQNTGANLDAGGIGVYASGSGSTTELTLEKNVIRDNKAGYGGGVMGYAWGTGALATIALSNNILAGNEALMGGAIFSCSGKTDPGTIPGGTVNWRLTNNTITANRATQYAGGIQLHSGSNYGDGGSISISMRNDVLWGNSDPQGGVQLYVGVEIGKSGAASADLHYSDVGSIAAYGAGTYSLDQTVNMDPQFADPANYNFLLQTGSPVIDSGDPNPLYNDGQRPPGRGTERADMGAYGGPNYLN